MNQRSPPGTWRLLLPALIAWGVAAWAVSNAGSGAWVIGAAASMGGCALVWTCCSPSSRHGSGRVAPGLIGALLLLCAALLLIGARVTVEQIAREDPLLAEAANHDGVVRFDAALAGFPEGRTTEFGDRYWVAAEAETPSGAVPVLLWLSEPPGPTWAPGLRVDVVGSAERFDAGSDAAYGIAVRRLTVEASGSGTERLGALAAELRIGLRSLAGQVEGAELVPGFAVGDTSLVGEDLDRAMRDSSLTHLTAVSGANCALITGAVLALLARLGVGRRPRAVCAVLALAGFVGIVGPDASVQRAAVMAGVLLISSFGGKRAAALPALGLAVLLLLVVDPWQALQPGFALSVAATGGILLAATPVAGWLHRRARLPRVLALPVAVACAAQLACGPFLLFLQPGIPAIGVLANVVAAPAAPIGTGFGLLAALLAPFSPELATLAVVLAGIAARWVAATAELSASLPFSRWHWPSGWPGMLALVAVQGAILASAALARGWIALPGGTRTSPRRPWHGASPAPRSTRRAIAALTGIALGLGVALVLAVPAAERLGVPSGWAIVACDVGQGDAVLIRDPDRPEQVMLVDTGDDPALLHDCLDRFGVQRISLLVLSHDDRDHVGALPDIVDRVDGALIAPESADQTHDTREVVRRLERARVPYRVASAGDRSTAGSERGGERGLRWEVLAPSGRTTPGDSNAASLVMRVFAGDVSVLLLGDTGLDEQRALIRSGVDLRADVIKVAHHGSRDQDQRLPGAVAAQWALVSVGAGNRHGHPADETIAALERAGTRVLRTDEQGSAALVPEESGLRPWVQRVDVGGSP